MISAETLRVCRGGKPVPTFRGSSPDNKKAPVLSGGASVQQMRSFDYARTSPKAREGFVVFLVVFATFVMARTYARRSGRRQRPQMVKTRLNPAWLSRHK